MIFGTYALPHVLSLATQLSHLQLERDMPSRNCAYRSVQTSLGKKISVSGEIRGTTISDVALHVEMIRRLADDVARSTDLEDGTTPTVLAKLVSPEFTFNAAGWFSGKYRVPYSVTFLETT